MRRALVFDTDVPFLLDDGRPSSVDAGARMAGLTLLRRAILAAWRAGAADVTVVASDAAAVARWSRSEVGLPVPVRVLGPDAPSPEAAELEGGPDWVLVTAAQIWVEPAALEALFREAARAGGPVAAWGLPGCSGPTVVRGADLAAAGGPAARAVRALLLGTGVRRLPVDGDACARIDSPEALAETDRRLYRDLTSVTDGYIDRVFNRRISRWFTRRIIDLPITPNHVTAFHFALGLAAVGLFATGNYLLGVLGALLFQVSVALDCTDGEVARLKYQFSKLGSRLDVAADNVVHAALFAAASRVAASRLGAGPALLLGALAVAGVILCVAVVYALARLQARRAPGSASALAATNRLGDLDPTAAAVRTTPLDRLLNAAATRDFSVLVAACALAGHLEWIVWLAAVGTHAFWILYAAVQLASLRARHAEGS